jgi:hypothetical protein
MKRIKPIPIFTSEIMVMPNNDNRRPSLIKLTYGWVVAVIFFLSKAEFHRIRDHDVRDYMKVVIVTSFTSEIRYSSARSELGIENCGFSCDRLCLNV